jgi:hypothetical protein
VKVDKECGDAIRKVTTAKSYCDNNVVKISGDIYYYCPKTNQFQVRHYDYTPNPIRACTGNGTVLSTPVDTLPEGMEMIGSGCRQTDRKVVQWIQTPKNWERVTWTVAECVVDGKTVDRLIPSPDRYESDTSSDQPAPIDLK